MADANISSTKSDRKVIGKSLGLAIVISAALVCLFAVWVYINRPETDDATMRANFIGIDRLDNGYMAGASINYEMWRNLMLTLDYQYTTVQSDAAFSDFTRNWVSAGLTYRY